MDRYVLVPNDEEECWELQEIDAIETPEGKENVVIARFYDGDCRCSLLGLAIKNLLNILGPGWIK